MTETLIYLFIFPGLLFLLVFSFIVEYLDRKLYARMQNRVGPPFFQPFADFLKLVGKEEIIPEEAEPLVFKLIPLFAFTATVTAFFYIPLWSTTALFSFDGDLIVILYLLTIPTLCFFLGGWYSQSAFAMIGATRALTQFFAYEVPMILTVLSAALLAGTWSLSEITAFYAQRPILWIFNLLGLTLSIIALLGKLEKVPFDIPEAETEIVAGYITEYSGRLYAFFRMTLNIEMIVVSSLLAAVFMPWGLNFGPYIGFLLFIVKLFIVLFIIAVLRTVLARFRIDQMINFCWKYVSTAAFALIIVTLILKGVVFR